MPAPRKSRRNAQAPLPAAEGLVTHTKPKGKGRKKKATPATPQEEEPTDRQLLLQLATAFKGFETRLTQVEGDKAAPATPASIKPKARWRAIVSPTAQEGAAIR